MPQANHEIITITFHGAKLIAIRGETPEATLVAMKPMVEGMGLNWEKQRIKLNGHPVLAPTVRVVPFQTSRGEQDGVCLPLNRVGFWLATITPSKVPDSTVRAKVIEYQTECADVLFAHFFGKATGQQPMVNVPAPTDPAWAAWLSSTDERRTRQRDVLIYRQSYGATGMRIAMHQVGMPLPPAWAIGAREQLELDMLHKPGVTVTVNVPNTGM